VSGQIEHRPKRWILLQERRNGLEWLYDQSFSQVSEVFTFGRELGGCRVIGVLPTG
jgi:hypothetical protein